MNTIRSTKYVKPKRITSSPYYAYFSKNSKIFVAIENNEIVGFISGRLLNQKDKTVKKYGKLDDLFIVEQSRGAGFASELVDSLLKWFKKNKCNQAYFLLLLISPYKNITAKSDLT